MDFGAAAAASQQNGGLSFFDGGATAAEISSALQSMPRLNAAITPAADNGLNAGTANPEKKGKNRMSETTGKQAVSVATVPAAPAPVGQQPQRFVDFASQQLELGSDSCSSSTSSSSTSSMLALAQKSTRTAKNGREQQRAQKISDVIDQLKVRVASFLVSKSYFLDDLFSSRWENGTQV